MKKSLVLAMAMALGVTASAYAANPFSDVPAGHWAYDSISKLAAAGVVEGYPDGSFKGDNLMTRYEMAQIVAKAMAKGANVDALAAEFAEELDNLGVRVAALEKKADNVKITGQIRYRYAKFDGKGDSDEFRSRITISGQINEDWSYSAMLQNRNYFDGDQVGQEGTEFQRAYLDGKLGGLKVRAGRYNFTSPNANSALAFGGTIHDTRIDGVTANYGKTVKVTGTVGKFTNVTTDSDFWMIGAQTNIGKAATLNAGYYSINNQEDQADDKEIINVGLALKAGKAVKVLADWYKVNSDIDAIDGNQGWEFGVKFAGANAKKPGTFGIDAKYVDLERGIQVANGWNACATPKLIDNKTADGVKGFVVGGYYTIAKNIVAGVEYYSLEGKENKDGHNETLWSQVVFTF